MIRCHADIEERQHAKKGHERPADPRRPVIRVGFDDLIAREAWRLERLSCPAELRRLAARLEIELRAPDYERFVAWVEGRYGNAFARQGGLPVGPPRLTLAS